MVFWLSWDLLTQNWWSLICSVSSFHRGQISCRLDAWKNACTALVLGVLCCVAASAEVHSRSFDDNLALGYLGSLAFRSVREVYVVDHLPPQNVIVGC
jgi:hypothetical protein